MFIAKCWIFNKKILMALIYHVTTKQEWSKTKQKLYSAFPQMKVLFF